MLSEQRYLTLRSAITKKYCVKQIVLNDAEATVAWYGGIDGPHEDHTMYSAGGGHTSRTLLCRTRYTSFDNKLVVEKVIEKRCGWQNMQLYRKSALRYQRREESLASSEAG